MKKAIIVLACIFATMTPLVVLSQNFAAGEITYLNLGGNEYQVTVRCVRDCRGDLLPDSITVDFNSSCNSFSSRFPQASPAEMFATTCPGCITCCDSLFPGCNYGFYKYTYRKQIHIPTCSDWVISFSGSYRNMMDNLANSTSQNFYISAGLNSVLGSPNSGPNFTNYPFLTAINGQPFCYNHGAYDPDGDSLVFSLVAPQKDAITQVDYTNGFSPTYPLPLSTTFGFDGATGTIYFTPTQSFLGSFSIKCDEYRRVSGVPKQIGYTIRDMQIYVLKYDTLPSLSGINPLATQYNPGDTNFVYNTAPGDTIDFNIYAYDPDPAIPFENLKMNYFCSQGNANWSITGNNTPNPVGHFHRDPTYTNTFPINFRIRIEETCPCNGAKDYFYTIEDTTTINVNNIENEELPIEIYPNPAHQNLSVILPYKPEKSSRIEILTMDGKLKEVHVVRKKENQIDISALKPGIYMLRYSCNNGYAYKKFIKE